MTKINFLTIIFFLITNAGCDNPKPVPETKQKSSSKVQRDNSLDFQTFFKKFSKDSIFQKKHLDKNLELVLIDPYDQSQSIQKIRDKWTYIDFKEAPNNDSDAYKFSIEPKKDTVFYIQQGIDNGIRIEYIFVRKNDTWYLVLIKDESA